MVIRSRAACPADVLIHVPHLHVEGLAGSITHSHIRPVLVECLSVDRRCVSKIEENLVLNRRKHPLGKRPLRFAAQGHNTPEEISEPVRIAIAVMNQIAVGGMMFGNISLLHPQPVSKRRPVRHLMGIHQLLPNPVLRQIALDAAIDPLLGDKGVTHRTRQLRRKIKIHPGPDQQLVQLPHLVGSPVLHVEEDPEFRRQLIIVESGDPACKLGLSLGGTDKPAKH